MIRENIVKSAKLAVLTLLLAVCPCPISSKSADEPKMENGNGLLRDCEDANSNVHYGICYGFIIGVTDTYVTTIPDEICIPDHATHEQIRDIAVKYLVDHPDKRHLWSAMLVMESLRDAFPCSK